MRGRDAEVLLDIFERSLAIFEENLKDAIKASEVKKRPKVYRRPA
jgi:hypothetical protein